MAQSKWYDAFLLPRDDGQDDRIFATGNGFPVKNIRFETRFFLLPFTFVLIPKANERSDGFSDSEQNEYRQK